MAGACITAFLHPDTCSTKSITTATRTHTYTPNVSSTPSLPDIQYQELDCSATSASGDDVRSSSSDGARLCSYVEEGQGESSSNDHLQSSLKSSRPQDSGDGECERDMAQCRSAAMLNGWSSLLGKVIEQEQEYFQQILGSSSYGWTDEKHSSYLDSMEADFLRSVMFRHNTHDEEASSELSDCASSQHANGSRKFKVCQNGRWKPKSVNASFAGSLVQVAVAVKNPWIKRYRSSMKAKVFPLSLQDPPLLQVAMDSKRRGK